MQIFVEVRLDKKKQLPAGAASALAIELNTRLQRKFPDVEATVSYGRYGRAVSAQWYASGRGDTTGDVGKCG